MDHLPPTATGPAAAAPDRLRVDLADRGGPVLRGANGALYGLSDDGVPGDAILAPLRLTSISQKPEGGLQHPNGDALTVAEAHFRAGGGDVFVLVQDVYRRWPYEDLGFDDYLAKLDAVARRVAAHPRCADFVLVPFNEPDAIWYGLNAPGAEDFARNADRFLDHWRTAHARVRSVAPGLRVAGPNETRYDHRFLPRFLAFARDHGVLPDILTWHELDAASLRDFPGHHDHLRAVERDLGIAPLPVCVTEYGNRRDLSVPGQLVQWTGMFERAAVHANQAYWDVAGNLDGNVAQTNIPNGGWWFFRWYAAMPGDTVRVDPPRPHTIDTLQGLASLDARTRQAHAVLGGAAGDADVVFAHVPADVFGDAVVALVQEAAWTGYEGAHAAPRTLLRTVTPVAPDGTVTVPLRGMDRMSAYRVVLLPAGDGTPDPAPVPWRASHEAEDAAITGGRVRVLGTVADANGYAASNARDVEGLDRPGSAVAFTVTVPEAGAYDLDILYGNATGEPARQRLTVDDGPPARVTYPCTLNDAHRSRLTVPVRLSAGTHTLTLAHDHGAVTLDRIDLTAGTGEPFARYEATLADTTGRPERRYADASGLGTGALLLGAGDAAVFDVYAPRDGSYRVAPRADGPVALAAHGALVRAAAGQEPRLLLAAGNNRITVTGPAALTSLDVRGAGDGDGLAGLPVTDARRAGGATVVRDGHAPEGHVLDGLGAGASATWRVRAERGGPHLLFVEYANDARADTGHAYNADVISATALLRVNGGAARRVTFRNTHSRHNFWTLAVPLALDAGDNTLVLIGEDGPAPAIARLRTGPVVGG
ncbi:CBM35 domain-containing protein [Streptomyces marincola]|uniref:Cellulosome protein n=1 Tax=Streptomyces marincola TaxID=2878388 RepID=A0A1W7CSY3_9ACTN|nr:CBM35 domain-containing protein [Streptomyces marincola]ARQ67888.1 cellulosome protein [Streptomyces marincola]